MGQKQLPLSLRLMNDVRQVGFLKSQRKYYLRSFEASIGYERPATSAVSNRDVVVIR